MKSVAIVASVVGLLVSVALTQQAPRDYSSGVYLYRTFCATCHGDAGRGDGPSANTLPTAVPDLSTITRRSGGAFPRGDVLAAIDGSKPMPGHATSAMPKWRDVLRSVEGDNPRVIRQRIEALANYVESLQIK